MTEALIQEGLMPFCVEVLIVQTGQVSGGRNLLMNRELNNIQDF